MALYRFNFGSADKSLFESGGSADFSLYSRSGVADSGGAKTKFAGIRVTGSSFLGDAAGDTTTICGNLVVTGNTTTINSTTLQVDDKNIELGTVDTPTDTTADGGGITLKGATDKTILWTNATDSWDFNQGVCVTGNIIAYGDGYMYPSYSRFGRNAMEFTEFHVDDATNTIKAVQDSDSNSNHYFALDRSFAGSGLNFFQIRCAGTAEVTVCAGKVGIGTTSPGAAMHVHSSGDVGHYITSASNVTDSANTSLWFAHNYGTVTDWAGIIFDADDKLRFNNSGSSNDSHLVITDAGKVGIGTDSPTCKLEIAQNAGQGTSPPTLRITNTYASYGSGATLNVPHGAIEFHGDETSDGGGPFTAIKDINTSAYGSLHSLSFHTKDGWSPYTLQERMRIWYNGNVGIGLGNTSPSAKLDVSGAIKVSSCICSCGDTARWHSKGSTNVARTIAAWNVGEADSHYHYIKQSARSTNNNYTCYVSCYTSEAVGMFFGEHAASGGYGDWFIKTKNSGGSYLARLHIDTGGATNICNGNLVVRDGNVGIGTASPL